jgi:uncharacterized membrane protein YkoI
MILSAAVVAALVGLVACASEDEEKEDTITLDKVPAAVKTTLATYAADSEVKKAEVGDEDGKKEYEFEIEKASRKFEVAIAPDGKYLGQEEDVALSATPGAVSKAFADAANGGKVSNVEKAVDAAGKVTYEADIEKDGKKSEVEVDADGKVLKTESEGKEKD